MTGILPPGLPRRGPRRLCAQVVLAIGLLAPAPLVALSPAQAALVRESPAAAPRWRTLPTAPDPSGNRDPAAKPSQWRTVEVQRSGPRSRLVPASAVSAQTTGIPADAGAVAAVRTIPYLLAPSLGGALPTGYVGGWGDYYLAGSAATPGDTRAGSPDGSVNLGFSLGDPERLVGVDLNWGIGSIKNFNANGSVAVAAGRILVNRPDLQVAVAGGLLDVYSYGSEPGKPQVNGYGAVTVAVPLRPGDRQFPQRLQLSVGGGGNSFAAINANFQSTETGFFAAAGVDLLPNLGVSLGQSSRSTNVNLSWIPLKSLPVFVNLVAADVFDATPFGTVGVLSVGWGDSLRRGFFSD